MEENLNGFNGEVRPTVPEVPQYHSTGADLAFAAAYAVVAYMFIRTAFFSDFSFGVFAVLFFALTFCYMRFKGHEIKGEALFWGACALLAALSCLITVNQSFAGYRSAWLFMLAIWLPASLSGKRVGDTLLSDGLTAAFAVPFSNFGAFFKTVFAPRKDKKRTAEVVYALLGVAAFFLIAAVVLPLLIAADGGVFASLVDSVTRNFGEQAAEFFLAAFLSVPTVCYLFGHAAGYAQNRVGEKKGESRRFLPNTTAAVALILVCALYLVFIGAQIPYFFSAFTGALPQGFEEYAEYARSGFFELCTVAVINLAIIIFVNLSVNKGADESALIRVLNVLLSALTLVIIASAASKMCLYIDAYGLSQKRLLTLIVFAVLAVVWVCVIIRQWVRFSPTRVCVLFTACVITLLCFVSVDRVVAEYNATRYISGTLEELDMTVFKNGGVAGINAAKRVIESERCTESDKYVIADYFDRFGSKGQGLDFSDFNLEEFLAR